MTIPSFLIGLLISTLYGALFHIWRGGGLGRLFLFILLGWVGFWGGQVLGDVLGWAFLPLGPLKSWIGNPRQPVGIAGGFVAQHDRSLTSGWGRLTSGLRLDASLES